MSDTALPEVDYAHRLSRARRVMEKHAVEALVLSVGSDLPYLTGYEAMATERLTMAVIAPEAATLVVPRLEAPRVADNGIVAVVAWDETEDPIAIVAQYLGDGTRAAMGAQTWSRFLLRLQGALPAAGFVDATALMRELRIVKDDFEVEMLRRAGAAADRVTEQLRATTFGGRTEAEMAREVEELILAMGHDSVAFRIVASGPNAASPHHEPGSRRIGAGDSVVVDLGGRVAGYCSDTTRTFFVGEPPSEYRAAYDVLYAAQRAATAAVRPGIAAEEVDRTARRILDETGWGKWFIHRVGHGIGRDEHEDPYLVEGNRTPLESGMAFSVEPGVYKPGEWGMRLEDIVVCTDDGAESLNNAPRDLAIVD